MNKDKQLATAAMSAVIALGIATASSPVKAAEKKEKCYGVVKAKANDCGTPKHPCAKQATKDGDPNEWLLLPKGLCERLVNGEVKDD